MLACSLVMANCNCVTSPTRAVGICAFAAVTAAKQMIKAKEYASYQSP